MVGAQGVIQHVAQNHNGMDQRARVMMTVRTANGVLIRTETHLDTQDSAGLFL